MSQRTALSLASLAVHWGLKALNRADALLSFRAAQRTASAIPYGPDPRQRLDVYVPRGRGEGPWPVAVFFYGGSWLKGERGDYGFAGRALAGLGFVAIVPDYRLVDAHPYPAFMEDGAAAVRWARDQAGAYGGDTGDIVLAGHSAGAYIAVTLGLDRLWLDEAGVPSAAIRALIGLSGPYDFYPFTSAVTRHTFGHTADPAATQPVAYARPDAPPALLVHGAEDRSVGSHTSKNLAARLQAAGATADLRLYPGVRHSETLTALSRPLRRRAPVLANIAAFLARPR